jgi:uncharacterized protein with HEPN domain
LPSSRDPGHSLRDIADAIDNINQFTAGMDLEAFRADLKTIAAVERKLLVISEAAVRLGDAAVRACPGAPWPEIRGIGNWLRHQYDHVDLETIWNTVQQDLRPLKAAIVSSLRSSTSLKSER